MFRGTAVRGVVVTMVCSAIVSAIAGGLASAQASTLDAGTLARVTGDRPVLR
jgi:hypothetical protein